MPPAAAARSHRWGGGRNYTKLVGTVVAVSPSPPSPTLRPVYDPNLTARAGAHGRARADPRAVESNSPRSYTVAAAPFSSVFTARQNSSAPRRAIAYGVQRVRPCLCVCDSLTVCVCVYISCARARMCTPIFVRRKEKFNIFRHAYAPGSYVFFNRGRRPIVGIYIYIYIIRLYYIIDCCKQDPYRFTGHSRHLISRFVSESFKFSDWDLFIRLCIYYLHTPAVHVFDFINHLGYCTRESRILYSCIIIYFIIHCKPLHSIYIYIYTCNSRAFVSCHFELKRKFLCVYYIKRKMFYVEFQVYNGIMLHKR